MERGEEKRSTFESFRQVIMSNDGIAVTGVFIEGTDSFIDNLLKVHFSHRHMILKGFLQLANTYSWMHICIISCFGRFVR